MPLERFLILWGAFSFPVIPGGTGTSKWILWGAFSFPVIPGGTGTFKKKKQVKKRVLGYLMRCGDLLGMFLNFVIQDSINSQKKEARGRVSPSTLGLPAYNSTSILCRMKSQPEHNVGAVNRKRFEV
jgi:hypothetical protein